VARLGKRAASLRRAPKGAKVLPVRPALNTRTVR
jgi:hypothetical protein